MGEDNQASCNINILTLNCWGIPRLSKDRQCRVNAIAEEIACSKYDVVCLQEVWSDDDYEHIKKKVAETMPYSHYFHSGVIGSGLCVFSRHEIVEVLFHQWQLNGYIHKIFHADWFGGKGVGLCQVIIHGFRLNVYTTHLHAQYDCNNDEYLAHRLIQAFDTAQFIRVTAASADLCVLAGDLNVETEDLCFQLIQQYARLSDAMTKAGHDCMSTYECSRNSYTKKNNEHLLAQGQRIDHIMYRAGSLIQAELTSHDYSFQERIPGMDISYSDHEAINATFRLSKRGSAWAGQHLAEIASIDTTDSEETLDIKLEASLLKALDVCDAALSQLRRDRVCYICLVIILATSLLVISLLPPSFPLSWLPWLLRSHHIVPVLVSLTLVFCCLMAFLWNSMEYNGVLCGQSTIRIASLRLHPGLISRGCAGDSDD